MREGGEYERGELEIYNPTFSKPNYKRKRINREFKEKTLPYCQYCGTTSIDQGFHERHHIIFRSQGGSNHWKNRIDLCGVCHKKAGAKLPGYLPKDLYMKRYLDRKRQKAIDKIFEIPLSCSLAGCIESEDID